MSFWDNIKGLFGSLNNTANAAPTTTPTVPVQTLPVPGTITAIQLHAIMPYCPQNELQPFAQYLSAAMQEGQITTVQRMACFLGQIAYESNQLRAWVEDLNYSVNALMATWPRTFPTAVIASQYAMQPQKLANHIYANRIGNGPEVSGDGWNYRGRGPIQLTGKANYQAAGQFLSVDLVANPDWVASSAQGFRVAVWYWTTHNLNQYADANDIISITRAINGGTLGLQAREAYTQQALAVLSKS